MKHIVEEHDGMLWIYVQRNAKLVTITRNGYIPINRFDLHTTIESGKNYVMTLSPGQKKVYTQMVQFKIKPSIPNAIVMVKSQNAGSQEELFGHTDSTGQVAKSLEYGIYTYKILSDNYHMAEGRFALDNRTETLVENVDLQPNFSDMTFNVEADADIYINGEFKGKRHWAGPLKTGNYQIECRQANHKPTSQFVQVVENDNKTINLKVPEPILGTVAITSVPLGADIYIDGKSYGQTAKNIELITGFHTIEFSKIGYQTKKQSFEVREDEIVEVTDTLSKMTKAEINSIPTGSKLYIDVSYKGNTPFTFEGEAGYYKVKLTYPGYDPLEKKVYFGNSTPMSFTLQRQSVFYIEAGVGLGTAMNATVGVGFYSHNFNIELDYSYGFKKSPTVYWYLDEQSSKYQPSLILAGKVGYRINMNSRLNVTPQIGYKVTKLSEIEATSGGPFIDGANCSCLSVGLRGYCKISSHFGISITPEYAIGVSKSEGYKILSSVGSKITELAEGFNAKIALVLTF